ncbi:MAG: C-GCAxxG-C-C family protein [Pontiellaceae bacterium]|nr:C-GCAxxG-C-C family protein [Pontiellaceae bacterium]MBN2786123.1 C-GCAxxG-C-C family protein [Pontiellaceae bacterium]
MQKLIEDGFFAGKDLNCAETILHAANEVHGMNLSKEALLLSSGFGGGVGGQELLCGALAGGVMALGKLFVQERAHESDLIKTIIQDYFALYKKEMGHVDCAPLKAAYRSETEGCRQVILASARCIDQIVEKYRQEMA